MNIFCSVPLKKIYLKMYLCSFSESFVLFWTSRRMHIGSKHPEVNYVFIPSKEVGKCLLNKFHLFVHLSLKLTYFEHWNIIYCNFLIQTLYKQHTFNTANPCFIPFCRHILYCFFIAFHNNTFSYLLLELFG